MLEKVVQKYLFEHLWLLDPSWGRVSGSELKEQTLTRHLRKACPDTEKGARLDIAYRTEAGRHVIIELKRPSLAVKLDELEMQGRKYYDAMQQYYRDDPEYGAKGLAAPTIDIFLLIKEHPPVQKEQQGVFDQYNIKILTYIGLIRGARRAYKEYLETHTAVGSIEAVLKALS